MAKRFFGTPKIGAIVYEPFTPAKVGIIVGIGDDVAKPGGPAHVMIHVRWLRRGLLGAPERTDSWQVNDYEDLTESHERKAAKFRATINNIREQHKD